MPRGESWTAKYFTALPSQSECVGGNAIPSLKCNLCGKVLQAARQSLSNRNRHMHTYHQDIVQSSSSQEEGEHSESGGGAITKFVKAQKLTSRKQEDITSALVQFIASAYLPLSAVENPSFRGFIRQLNPGYQVPSRKWLRSQILKAAAEKKTLLKKELCCLPTNRTITITMDLWSSRQLLSYMGMTTHFVSSDGKLRSDLLTFRRFTGRHTGDNIRALYQDVMIEYGIEGKVLLLVTDGASNMLKAFKPSFGLNTSAAAADDEVEEEEPNELDEAEPAGDVDESQDQDVLEELAELVPERISCGAHSLQLVVKDGLRDAAEGAITRVLTKLNNFVGRAKKVTHAAEILSQRKHTLQRANVTRWNSQLKTIDSLLALPDDLLMELKCLPALEGLCPTTAERTLLKEVATILHPFAIATDLLQGDKIVTSSHMLPTIRGLWATMSTGSSVSKAADRLRTALMRNLERRFRGVEESDYFITATILDPRFKLLPWSSIHAGMESEVQGKCLQHLQRQLALRPAAPAAERAAAATSVVQVSTPTAAPEVILVDDDSDDPPAADSAGPVAQTAPAVTYSHAGLYSFMKKSEASKSRVSGSRISLEMEMAQYLSEELLPDDAHPLEYWATAKTRYPQLYVAAVNHLSIPASSGPSERIFSVSGKLITPSRSRLDDDIIEALMFVKC